MTTYYRISDEDVRALHRFFLETAQANSAVAAAATRSALALEELEVIEQESDEEPQTDSDDEA